MARSRRPRAGHPELGPLGPTSTGSTAPSVTSHRPRTRGPTTVRSTPDRSRDRDNSPVTEPGRFTPAPHPGPQPTPGKIDDQAQIKVEARSHLSIPPPSATSRRPVLPVHPETIARRAVAGGPTPSTTQLLLARGAMPSRERNSRAAAYAAVRGRCRMDKDHDQWPQRPFLAGSNWGER